MAPGGTSVSVSVVEGLSDVQEGHPSGTVGVPKARYPAHGVAGPLRLALFATMLAMIRWTNG